MAPPGAMPQAALLAQNMPVKGMGMPVRPGMEDSEEDSDGNGHEAAALEEAHFGAAPAELMLQQKPAVEAGKVAVEEEAGFGNGESAFMSICCYTRWHTRSMALSFVREERDETERSLLACYSIFMHTIPYRLQDAE